MIIEMGDKKGCRLTVNSSVRYLIIVSLLLWLSGHAVAQQSGDRNFIPSVNSPLFEDSAGPLVLIDEYHNNFHTKDGRYQPFAKVLEADGYLVAAGTEQFSNSNLAAAKVLVISNALGDTGDRGWRLSVLPAFSDEEINAVEDFVAAGGGLFLIADHMPFPGAAAELAAVFGVEFSNAFAFEIDEDHRRRNGPTVFRRSEKRIGNHPITNGRNDNERIQQVASFTGSAFPLIDAATSILQFGDNAQLWFPTEAWQFDSSTPVANIPSWSQGLALNYGEGRVVVFGEAAMFTLQHVGGQDPVGLRSAAAKDNEQLLLNIVHWLSGHL